MAISTSKHCPHCGSDHKGEPFCLYEDGYHCFSCGATKRAIRNFNVRQLKSTGDVKLPPLTRNPSMFSVKTLQWLRQYHVTDDLIYKHHLSEANDNSLITPVLVDGEVVMYQRRWFEDQRRIMTYGVKQPHIIHNGRRDTIVIVEDFISAIRVGERFNSFCMFGTSISYDVLEDIVKSYKNILIWADGDKAGQTAAKKLVNKLTNMRRNHDRIRAFSNTFDKKIDNVLTNDDPKCYTNTKISKIIKEKLC